MNLVQQRLQLQTEVEGLLSNPNATANDRKQADALLSRVADIRAMEARQERLDAATAETLRMSEADRPEYKAAKMNAAFKRYLRTGSKEALAELRTYTPMVSGDTPLPQGFISAYAEKLKSFSGLYAVSNILETKTGDGLKYPFADDSGNVGERLDENSTVTLVNPTFSDVVFGAFRYSSKGVKYSAQLLQDAGFDLTEYFAEMFAKRIGKITNAEFTNGGSGGPTGVIPSLTQVQTSASATAVTVAEIVALQALDEGYLTGSVYQFSPGVERTLKAMVNTDGLPVFPEMRSGRVLAGYGYTLNVDMPASLTASAKTIVFGDFKRGITIRSVLPSLAVSAERFAESNQMYASLRHDMDVAVVDATALNVLQQHS